VLVLPAIPSLVASSCCGNRLHLDLRRRLRYRSGFRAAVARLLQSWRRLLCAPAVPRMRAALAVGPPHVTVSAGASPARPEGNPAMASFSPATALTPGRRENRAAALAVLGASLVLAVVSARNWTSWNDSSRLAAAECLVDYHTLAIDHSYLLSGAGGDKIFVHGHYYSDKAPVSYLLLAAIYQLLQSLTGLVAAHRPAAFAYAMALGSSGMCYVIAVWCVFRLTRLLALPHAGRLALTASFGLATLAPIYARQVNSHIQLLAVSAALFLMLTRIAADARGQAWRLLGLGSLTGLAYTLDLGVGSPLLLGTACWIAWRCRHGLSIFLAGVVPWLALHHAVNYSIGGTLKPAGSVPEYFTWPGCPFAPGDLTGGWNHPSLGSFLAYAGGLLVGPRGFLCHNLPLFLAVPGLLVLLRRRVPETPQLLLAAFWAGGAWLVYALFSTNYSGLNLSIRWFVPLLIPGFYVLAVLLRHFPRFWPAFLVLSGWGVLLAVLMWPGGTWYRQEVRWLWPINGGAVVSLLACQVGIWLWALRPRNKGALLSPAGEPSPRRAA
jgi:hypothetical protein